MEFKDPRIHCVLYFINPTGHALSALDIMSIEAMSEVTNVIPVIAKSDCLSNEEKNDFKKRIREDIIFHNLKIYPDLLSLSPMKHHSLFVFPIN